VVDDLCCSRCFSQIGQKPTQMAFDYSDSSNMVNSSISIDSPSGLYWVGVVGFQNCSYTAVIEEGFSPFFLFCVFSLFQERATIVSAIAVAMEPVLADLACAVILGLVMIVQSWKTRCEGGIHSCVVVVFFFFFGLNFDMQWSEHHWKRDQESVELLQFHHIKFVCHGAVVGTRNSWIHVVVC
jgi:hypothetical protein